MTAALTVRPTARGWMCAAAAVGTGLAGAWTGYPALLGLSTALGAAVIVAIVSVLVPAPVRVTRTVRPARVARLEDCTATITVKNVARRWSVSLAGTDRIGPAEFPFDLPRLRAGERASTDVPIPTERRGLIEFGPLTLERQSFADLLRIRRSHGEGASVLVEPRLLDAGGLPPGLRRGHIGADERIAHGGTDLVGLREYVPGDDLRRLHWATSARRATLMVREDADPANPYLTVLLDDRASSYGPDGPDGPDGDASDAGGLGGFDEAVDVAASLLASAAETSSPARLVTLSGEVDLDVPASVDGLGGVPPDVLARLATLRPRPGREADARGSALVSSPDVLAVLSGTGADLPELLLTAAAAPAGAVALVDDAPEALVSASGSVLLLRGPRAEELTRAWRVGVAPAADPIGVAR